MTRLLRMYLLVLFCGVLAACARPMETASYEVAQQPTLGTQWGEGIESRVQQVELVRMTRQPIAVDAIRYGVSAVTGSRSREVMLDNGRIMMSIRDDRGRKMTIGERGRAHWLQGIVGDRYEIHFENLSGNIYEVIATVDGLDVLNGRPGSFRNGGYVLQPHKTLVIEGFRKSDQEVAAFRFAAVDDAYAANTPAGDVRNIGVIGAAIFQLADPTQRSERQFSTPQAFPESDGYAPAPRYRH